MVSARRGTCWLAVALPLVAAVVTIPAPPVRPPMLRRTVKMQYGGNGAQHEAYAQQNYAQHEGYAQQSYSAQQVIWTLAGFCGVTGFSLYAEDPADLQIGRDSYRADCERYLYLPYTLRNGEEHVLSRWNMASPRLTVSRIQCRVQVLADGSAALVSRGRGPTLWRTLGGPWNWLYRDEWHMLADGDQVSLDWNDPEAAVLTCSCQLDSAMQHGGYQQQQQQQQQRGYNQQGYQGGGYPQQDCQGGSYPQSGRYSY